MVKKMLSNLKSKILPLIVFVIISGILLYTFYQIYDSPPAFIIVDPLSINESITINESNKELIKDISIKNAGPEEIKFSTALEMSNYTKKLINISLVPNVTQSIKSGETKFSSLVINSSKTYLTGDYKAAIVLNTSDKQIYKIIPVKIDIRAAKAGNSSSTPDIKANTT